MVDHEKGHTALHKAAAYKRRTICCMLGNTVFFLLRVLFLQHSQQIVNCLESCILRGFFNFKSKIRM
jgi:hypothetical protein